MQTFVPEWRELARNASYNRLEWAAAQTVALKKAGIMGRLIKLLVFLGVVAFLALTGYAYLGDMSPKQSTISQPVILNVDQ